MAKLAKNIKIKSQVKVIAGKDKGSSGEVLKVLRDRDRVVIKGVNVVKKHRRTQTESGIFEEEASIHISNVKIISENES